MWQSLIGSAYTPVSAIGPRSISRYSSQRPAGVDFARGSQFGVHSSLYFSREPAGVAQQIGEKYGKDS